MTKRSSKWMNRTIAACMCAALAVVPLFASQAGAAENKPTFEEVVAELEAKKPVPVFYEIKETSRTDWDGTNVVISKTWDIPGDKYRREDWKGNKLDLLVVRNNKKSVIHSFLMNPGQVYKRDLDKPIASKQVLEIEDISKHPDKYVDRVYKGEETINDRTAYHLLLKWRFQGEMPDWDEERQAKNSPTEELWFDKETGILLKRHKYSVDWERKEEVTKLKFPEKMPDNLFDLEEAAKDTVEVARENG